MMTESLWRDGRAARRRSVLDTDIVALSAVPPLVARRRQRGLSVTLAKLLPLALVMIAGPQILLRAIFVATTPNWWRNSAAFVVGAGAAITATVTIAFFASDGASNQQFFTDQVEWTTVETGEKIRGRGAVRDFIVALHMDPAH